MNSSLFLSIVRRLGKGRKMKKIDKKIKDTYTLNACFINGTCSADTIYVVGDDVLQKKEI